MIVRSFPLVLAVLILATWVPAPAHAADEEVSVPDVRGKPVAEALTALEAKGLTARVVEVAGPAAGVVDDQDPQAGDVVHSEAEVTLLVGTALRVPTKVPDVVGRPLDDVVEELESVYLVEVVFVAGPEGSAGRVLSQKPAAGGALLYRGVLELTVVQGELGGGEPAASGVLVPSVVGLQAKAARGVLRGLGLKASVTRVAGEGLPENSVISQDPPSGGEMLRGGTVFLRVARGASPDPDPDAGTVRVPLCVGMPMADAEAALLGAGLVPTLRYRTVTEYPAWACIAQDPAAGSRIPTESRVTLEIARPAPEPEHVVVPTVIGTGQPMAREILRAAGLEPVFESVPSDLPAGRVFEQEPSAGARVPAGTRVVLAVAETPPDTYQPTFATVPDLVGVPVSDALRLLLNRRLQGRVHERPAPNHPVDVVEESEPRAGVKVRAGTVVHVYVPEKTVVPDLVGHSRTEAIHVLQAAGLNALPEGPRVGVGGTRVTGQDPAPDLFIASGSSVSFYFVFTGGVGPVYRTVRVPNVVGLSRTEARGALERLGLRCACVGPRKGFGHTRVTTQLPAGGSLVRTGTSVRVTWVYTGAIGPGPVPGPGPIVPPVGLRVPNVVGQPVSSARSALQRAGFRVATVGPQRGRGRAFVAKQSPRGGSLVNSGITVRLHVVWR